MASTTEYIRQTSFTDAQNANPTAPLSGPGVDAELDRVKVALDSTQQSLDIIQRDDGALQNGIVTIDALAPGVRTGINPATQWATGTNYAVNDSVFVDDTASIKLYRCLEAHTSAALFATDLAASRWLELADFTPPEVVGTIAVADGGTGATTASGARTNLGLGAVAVEDVLPVAKGGTGADNAAAARTALGGSAVGVALFTTADAAAARTTLAAPGLAVSNAFSGANTIPNLNVLAQGVISGGAVGQIAVDIPSDFGGVEIGVWNFAPVTNAAQLAAQIGTGTVASPTWITADYRLQAITNTTPSTLAGSQSTGLSSWVLTSPIYKTVKFPNVSRYVIWGFNQTGFATIDGTTWGVPDPGTARVQAVQSGAHDNSVTPTILRLLATSGNIEDAVYLIRGIKKAV